MKGKGVEENAINDAEAAKAVILIEEEEYFPSEVVGKELHAITKVSIQ